MHTENVRSNEMFYCFASPYKDAECMHPVKKKVHSYGALLKQHKNGGSRQTLLLNLLHQHKMCHKLETE